MSVLNDGRRGSIKVYGSHRRSVVLCVLLVRCDLGDQLDAVLLGDKGCVLGYGDGSLAGEVLG
jgi:hypothetical protein